MTITDYITDYLAKTTVYAPDDRGYHIGLPYPYVTPCTGIYAGDQYYWDSYFIIVGLLELNKIDLAKGMIGNLAFMYQRFAIMPMRNRWSNLGISQQPYFTSMIQEVYKKTHDTDWLRQIVPIAEKELKQYWMDSKKAERHLIYKGLSRYADHYLMHATAEHESGWDMTSRFYEKCLDYLPIDLNICLYKYETDLAFFYQELQNTQKQEYYLQQAEKRKQIIYELLWHKEKGFFFDYNYKKKQQSTFYSLAGFYPLWAKLATKEQAEKLRKNLYIFEYEWGLATSQQGGLLKPFRQWDYPNGWPNLQWIVIKGLDNYGFIKDARRLAKKWLSLNEKVCSETGKLWEKYDVVKGATGKSGLYKTQPGFGWTNMIYVTLRKNYS